MVGAYTDGSFRDRDCAFVKCRGSVAKRLNLLRLHGGGRCFPQKPGMAHDADVINDPEMAQVVGYG